MLDLFIRILPEPCLELRLEVLIGGVHLFPVSGSSMILELNSHHFLASSVSHEMQKITLWEGGGGGGVPEMPVEYFEVQFTL